MNKDSSNNIIVIILFVHALFMSIWVNPHKSLFRNTLGIWGISGKQTEEI